MMRSTAFSSEVDAGSREENALKQNTQAVFRCNLIETRFGENGSARPDPLKASARKPAAAPIRQPPRETFGRFLRNLARLEHARGPKGEGAR